MRKTYTTKNNTSITVEVPNECPRCHSGMLPNEVFAIQYTNGKHMDMAYVAFRCPVCEDFFSTEYLVDEYGSSMMVIGSYPYLYEEEPFSKGIKELSPKFCQIYNEAKHAESEKLNEISGVGYRKALEFLVKDFAIKNKPDDKEAIAECWLGQCIKDHIDDNRIKKLAEKASWLGNDEAHFLRQYGDIDTIDKIKIFIKAIVNFIESYLAVEEAEAIEKKTANNKK